MNYVKPAFCEQFRLVPKYTGEQQIKTMNNNALGTLSKKTAAAESSP